jgi:hypothetical protein
MPEDKLGDVIGSHAAKPFTRLMGEGGHLRTGC